jgi:uncharacterized protein (DUF2147 family)
VRKLLLILIGAALSAVSNAVAFDAQAAGPEIAGDWLRSDGSARVRIAPCGAHICATNTWVKDENSGEAVGDRLVMTLQPVDSSRLVGAAFDVKRNRNYSVQISVDSKDSMQTHGCIIDGILCKTMLWMRAR